LCQLQENNGPFAGDCFDNQRAYYNQKHCSECQAEMTFVPTDVPAGGFAKKTGHRAAAFLTFDFNGWRMLIIIAISGCIQ